MEFAKLLENKEEVPKEEGGNNCPGSLILLG